MGNAVGRVEVRVGQWLNESLSGVHLFPFFSCLHSVFFLLLFSLFVICFDHVYVCFFMRLPYAISLHTHPLSKPTRLFSLFLPICRTSSASGPIVVKRDFSLSLSFLVLSLGTDDCAAQSEATSKAIQRTWKDTQLEARYAWRMPRRGLAVYPEIWLGIQGAFFHHFSLCTFLLRTHLNLSIHGSSHLIELYPLQYYRVSSQSKQNYRSTLISLLTSFCDFASESTFFLLFGHLNARKKSLDCELP